MTYHHTSRHIIAPWLIIRLVNTVVDRELMGVVVVVVVINVPTINDRNGSWPENKIIYHREGLEGPLGGLATHGA